MALDKWEKAHRRELAKIEKQILAIYEAAAQEAASIGMMVGELAEDLFSFDSYPITNERVKKLMKDMHDRIEKAVVDGVNGAWTLANNKNSELARMVFGGAIGHLTKEQYKRYFSNNDTARQAFLARKHNGLDLSDNVWHYTDLYKHEIELGLDVGIRSGASADVMSRELRQYLRFPDKIFRRVRDEHGMLKLSQASKQFHPGQGVYRSSYMNARRLAATETNMAYRTADYDRYQDLDFVVGIEVHLSNNHNCKGVPAGAYYDICDELQGKYPKDFKFTGWHPHCRCYVTSILKTDKEIAADNERIMSGLEPFERSENQVSDVPDGFKQWLSDNEDRIGRAHSIPYFLKDNGTITRVPHVLEDGRMVKWNKFELKEFRQPTHKPTLLEIAQQRHSARTPEQVQSIQDRWNKRREAYDLIKKNAGDVLTTAMDYGEIDFAELKAAIKAGNLDRMQSLSKTVEKMVSEIKKLENAISDLIPNAHSLHKTYSMDELKEAYLGIESVMKKWLSKYGYASLDAADIKHFRNKLKFELENPSIGYSNKNIVKEAITAKIKIIDRKIEWDDMVSKAVTLKSFKTRSTIYKDWLTKIDDAIQNDDFNALQKSIAEAENQQQKLLNKQIKKGDDIKSAINKEYKGGAIGKDITSTIDTSKMVSEDPYRGTFTNNVARLQGFDAPAKLVSESEFAMLEKACGEVFYRTVNPTKFKGRNMSSLQFAAQLYEADLLELNGPGGRAYGDGMYVATSAWDGYKINQLTENGKRIGYKESIRYGKGNHTISEMTFTRKPRIINQRDLLDMWSKLTQEQKRRFGGGRENTYACALGYDAMYCEGPNYMVIWNRSIIAVKRK